jgi:hypothetical protein
MTPAVHVPKNYCAIRVLYAISGIFQSVVHFYPLYEEKVVERVPFYSASGTVLTDDKANGSRITSSLIVDLFEKTC